MSVDCANIDVVILCGGKGERLREVIGEAPKAMAMINQTPFIRILIDYIASFGCKRFILCVGYGKNAIKQYIAENLLPVEILFSEESHALGTGGALKNASQCIKNSPFIVINGDSFFKINYHDFLKFHDEKQADSTIALFKPSSKRKDYGHVSLDEMFRVTSFGEKERAQAESRFCNGGVYLLNNNIFSHMPDGDAFSLEYDFFPSLTSKNFFGYIAEEQFIDIGTPYRYQQAQKILERE